MTWFPCGKADVGSLQALVLSSATGLPKFAPSTLNCTVPVGVPADEGAFTTALNETDCPATVGFAEDDIVRVGENFLITCVRASDEAGLKLKSPLYIAVNS